MQDHTTNKPSVKLCECGCGQPAPLAKQTDKRKGWIAGKPIRFIRDHYANTFIGTSEQRFWDKVDKRGPNDCWEWQAQRNRQGYGVTNLNDKSRLAHRASYKIHFGPIPDGLFVCHSCDNPSCVNPAHLWLGTKADNNRDTRVKGRHSTARGESHRSAKLTEDDVRDIRQRRAQGETALSLSRIYRVSRNTITTIVARKVWRHVE